MKHPAITQECTFKDYSVHANEYYHKEIVAYILANICGNNSEDTDLFKELIIPSILTE